MDHLTGIAKVELAPFYCMYGDFVIPQRYVLMVMLHLAVANCLQTNTFDWPYMTEYVITYTFFVGYASSHVPGGWLVDRIGGKFVLGFTLFMSSMATFILPNAIHAYGHSGATWTRALLGVCQGPMLPSVTSFVQNWAPPAERNLIGGVALCGRDLGNFLSHTLTGYIMEVSETWQMPFYIWAVCALVCFLFTTYTIFSSPEIHPFVTKKELDYLTLELEEQVHAVVPWCSMLTSSPIWALFFAALGNGYTQFSLAGCLPLYMRDVLKWELEHEGFIIGVSYLAMWVASIVCAWLADLLIRRKVCDVLNLRKAYVIVANMGPQLCIMVAVYLGCTRKGVLVLYFVALTLQAPIYAGVYLNCNDLSRNHAPIIMGFVNGLESIAIIVGPIIVEHLTPNGTMEEWQSVFWIISVVCTGTTCVFFFFGETERQVWDIQNEGD